MELSSAEPVYQHSSSSLYHIWKLYIASVRVGTQRSLPTGYGSMRKPMLNATVGICICVVVCRR